MKKLLLCILLSLFLDHSFGQNWINLDKPQSGVLGKLIISNVLNGDRIDTSLVQTEDGASEYKEVANSHFNIALKVTNFEKLKYLNAEVDTMSIDYLSDKALFQNDNYFTNPFVYKAIRAKSIIINFQKNTSGALDPSQILGSKIGTQIKKVIPLFDSLKLSYKKNDTISVKIFNPKVYFEAIAIELVNNDCDDCRVSFAPASASDGETFILDIGSAEKTSSQVNIPAGTTPAFKLTIDQDTVDDNKLLLNLSFDQGFANANKTKSIVAIPFHEIKIKGNKIRRFSLPNPQYYLGSIKTTDRSGLLSRLVTLDIPIFISVNAEQISPTQIKFINKDTFGKYMSKLEYPKYSFKPYNGKIF